MVCFVACNFKDRTAMLRILIVCFAFSFVLSGCKIKIRRPGEQKKKVVAEETVEVKPGNFRNTRWGDSKEQMMKTESGTPVNDNDDFFIYKGRLNGLDCQIFFQFYDGLLGAGGYVITEKHTNSNAYISDFDTFKKMLTEKYGEPKQDKKIWNGSLYKDDVENYGLAVSIGDLAYGAEWQTEETVIRMKLSGDNYRVNLLIVYSSFKYKDLVQKQAQREKSQGL